MQMLTGRLAERTMEGEAAAAAKRPGVFRAGRAGGQPFEPLARPPGPLVPRGTVAVHPVEFRVGLRRASGARRCAGAGGLEGKEDRLFSWVPPTHKGKPSRALIPRHGGRHWRGGQEPLPEFSLVF